MNLICIIFIYGRLVAAYARLPTQWRRTLTPPHAEVELPADSHINSDFLIQSWYWSCYRCSLRQRKSCWSSGKGQEALLSFIVQPKSTIIIFGEPSSDNVVKRNSHFQITNVNVVRNISPFCAHFCWHGMNHHPSSPQQTCSNQTFSFLFGRFNWKCHCFLLRLSQKNVPTLEKR